MIKTSKILLNLGKVVALVLVTIFLNSLPMLLIARNDVLSLPVKILASLFYIAIILIFYSFIWRYYQKQQPLEIREQKFGWKDFGIALLYSLVGRVIAILATFLLRLMTGQQETANDRMIQSVGQGQGHIFPAFIIFFVLTIGVFAPILEELTFRGLPQTFFIKGKASKIIGAILTSLVFGILHTSKLIELPVYFLLGLLFYLSFQRRGNIKDSIAVHILNNLPAAILLAISLFNQ
ncbi:CPBP family intramembrane glutamic endopeptidase [Streptococcus oricebi]|uniref:CPBP family intramembrane metalloprotease n=1 Tax=Streptococcus oricebi TaxID=1547447 RepID=A0ABS5B1Z6_9STRE|nr:type II CAAX endopeptidase family protein [Streptococcus oricebi]MBP2622855.1 CPBP family intramembrane metalloprotease [Streptococcus oricebi]